MTPSLSHWLALIMKMEKMVESVLYSGASLVVRTVLWESSLNFYTITALIKAPLNDMYSPENVAIIKSKKFLWSLRSTLFGKAP